MFPLMGYFLHVSFAPTSADGSVQDQENGVRGASGFDARRDGVSVCVRGRVFVCVCVHAPKPMPVHSLM